MKTKEITEIRADYTDDEGFIHIDVWESNDENAEGRTVAIVCGDTKKVFYIDNALRGHEGVKEAIKEVLEGIDMERALNGFTNPLDRIDWSELRNQKTTLGNLLGLGLSEEEESDIKGVLWTIGDLQRFAEDALGIDPIHLYDAELEDYLEEKLHN